MTDARKEQIDAIQTVSRNASRENFGKIRIYEQQLRNLVEGESFSEEQARKTLNAKAQTPDLILCDGQGLAHLRKFGEQVAISMLRDIAEAYGENFSGFSLSKFGRQQIIVG